MEWKDLSLRERAELIRIGTQNGITDIKSIKDFYNKFEEGGKKDSKDKSKVKEWVNERVYDRVYPREGAPINGSDLGTKGIAGALKMLLFGNPNDLQEDIEQAKKDIKLEKEISPESKWGNYSEEYLDALSFLAHEDAKDVYLGRPQKTGLLEESPYIPTITKGDNNKYYRFNFMSPEYWDSTGVIKDLLLSDDNKKQYLDQTMAHMQASKGMDDKGQYISIYDTWDYNTNIYGTPGDNVGKYIGGQPFDIYDRVYLDDYYGVPDDKRGTTYLPEIIVTPK